MQLDRELSELLALACDQLGMQAAFVAEMTQTQHIFRAVGGDFGSFGLAADSGRPREGTYCDLMLAGTLPNVVPDTTADPRVRDLPATTAGSIGAYVGVPLTLTDGRS